MYIWMSLQAKCHRCGCTQPPSTFGWWLVACKSKQGIWEKNFENFLFRIFKTRFQSFLKTFWCFEKLFLKILQILILSNGTRHTNQAIPAFKKSPLRYNILQQKSELQTLFFKFKLWVVAKYITWITN